MRCTKQKRLTEILAYAIQNGDKNTCINFGIKQETLERYKRLANKNHSLNFEQSTILKKISEIYSDKELQAIASGGRLVPGMAKVPVISFEGERIRIGSLGDLHLGSMFTDPDYVYQSFEEFKKAKVDFVTIGGDVVEGMSNRPGHIYELSHIGYTNQKQHAIDVLSQWTKTKVYCIDGNHDRWYLKSSGAVIVQDICNELDNYEYLGHDEGDISLKGKTTLKLWHGEDGSSYATSYRIQKVVESLTGGEKPGVMFFHHTHKFAYIFERHIHCISSGCIQKQSRWMRSKRIAAHTGFTINDIWVNNSGIAKVQCQFYPFYA